MSVNITELRKMDIQDLNKQAYALREEIADLRRRRGMGEVENVRTIRNKRKDLARMLTVLSNQLMKERA